MGNIRHPRDPGVAAELNATVGQFLTFSNGEISVLIGNGLADDGSGNIEIPLDAIDTDELDSSITPVWTGQHTFGSGIDMSSSPITNLPAPGNASDAARKDYVDASIEGLNLKGSSRAATDGTNIDLTSATDPNSIDGVTLNDGDRVLLKDQTDAVENGIYSAETATDPSTWVRTIDFDEDVEVTSGAFTFIEEGTVNGSSSYIVVTNDPIEVGVDPIGWSQFSSAGQFSAGDGLLVSGKEFSVNETFPFVFTSSIAFEGGLEAAGDGVKIFYGADLDMSTRYDAGDDDLKWRDEANTTDRMSLNRTTGDLTIDGTLDETSSP